MDESSAEHSMGEQVVASSPLIPSGLALRVGVLASGGVGGAAGIISAAGQAEKMRKDTAPGDHEGDLYMTVGRKRVAIFEMKRGLFKKSLGKLLVQFDRSDLKEVRFKPSRMGASNLDLEMNDGTLYELQAARVHRGKAEKIYSELHSS